MKKAFAILILLAIILALFTGCQATQNPNILSDEPLSEELKQNISHTLLMQNNVRMAWTDSNLYYGTINNCIVFRYCPEMELTVLTQTTIAGYVFKWYSAPLRFYAYRDGEVYELKDAYEKGWLTKEQIGKIHERHIEFYAQ